MAFNLQHNLRYKDHLFKYVKVKTVDSHEYEGWLKCIDPMSGNFFLTTLDESNTAVSDTVLIIRNACTDLEVLKEPDDKVRSFVEGLYRNDLESTEDVSERKNRLVAWIKKNRLPVSENEDTSLTVADNVTIASPYGIQNCSSMNARTLRSVRQLVAKLPSTFNRDVNKETNKP